MKKLLTVFLPDASADDGAPEQIELVSYNPDNPLAEAMKKAKGKYSLISECDLECDFNDEFFDLLNGENADILQFDGGILVKTALAKGCKNAADKFLAEVFSALSAKTLAKSGLIPFTLADRTRADGAEIAEAFTEFNKVKAKLNKDVYSLVFDIICGATLAFYARSLLDIRSGKTDSAGLAAFDERLKENTVFYHTVEKRFTYCSLSKLRKKNFKLGFFDYLKLKSKVK